MEFGVFVLIRTFLWKGVHHLQTGTSVSVFISDHFFLGILTSTPVGGGCDIIHCVSRFYSQYEKPQEGNMTHTGIWAAVDKVAEIMGLTPSALARRCGMDATAFNKSKRCTTYGQPRWPSSQTIAKIIETAGVSEDEFFRMARMCDQQNCISK